MTIKQLKTISNIVFGIAATVSVITLVLIAQNYYHVMGTGACPIQRYNSMVYLSLVCLFISMLVSTYVDNKVKKMEKAKTADVYDKALENRTSDKEEISGQTVDDVENVENIEVGEDTANIENTAESSAAESTKE